MNYRVTELINDRGIAHTVCLLKKKHLLNIDIL